MLVPTPPSITKLERISPTLYEAALKCSARAAWIATGDRKVVPPHPRALLGIGVHAVLERARSGGIAGATEEERRTGAEKEFDDKMREVFSAGHALLQAKFETPERLPFYNLYRARAAQIAGDFAPAAAHQIAASREEGVRTFRSGVAFEPSLRSKDGRIVGRTDVLDAGNEAVVDYKTGNAAGSGVVTDSEARQLRLYAFLAAENGVIVRKGVIERADRSRAEIAITLSEAGEESRRALTVLDDYNRHAGSAFDAAATPSAGNCKFCPCIPFCSAFWVRADESWAPECGTHVEGIVSSAEGDALVSVNVEVDRGTGIRGPGVVTRMSRDWLVFDGSAIPATGQKVRVTDVGYVSETSSPSVFRADRVTTALWRVAGPTD
jgi:hypothetical protein